MVIRELENEIRHIIASAGCFAVLEYERDASVTAATAAAERMKASMGVRRRQLMIKLDGSNAVTMEAGAMQWTVGNIKATAGFRNTHDFFGKLLRSALTDEEVVKPRYEGLGVIATEPTYKHLLLMDVGRYGPQGVTISDGMFLACDENVSVHLTGRKTVTSAVAGGEGLFNTNLTGNGIAVLKSSIPQVELLEIELDGTDELKLDGPMAVCWSTSLEFTVEKSATSILGSVVNKEGLVNVYRGKGIILISPVAEVRMMLNEDEAEANPIHHHPSHH